MKGNRGFLLVLGLNPFHTSDTLGALPKKLSFFLLAVAGTFYSSPLGNLTPFNNKVALPLSKLRVSGLQFVATDPEFAEPQTRPRGHFPSHVQPTTMLTRLLWV